MNNELIQQLGAFSHALLAAEEFKHLNALFEQQIAVDLLSTKPEDAAGRERIYSMISGSRAFTTHIEGFANDYVSKLAHTIDAETPSQDEDEDDPAVHDIRPESS